MTDPRSIPKAEIAITGIGTCAVYNRVMNITQIVKDFVAAARELDLQTIEREVRRGLRVSISSEHGSLTQGLLSAFGTTETRALASGSIQLAPIREAQATLSSPHPDLGIVVLEGSAEPSASEIAQIARLRAHSIPTILLAITREDGDLAQSAIANWFPDIPRDRIIATPDLRSQHVLQQIVRAVGAIDKRWLTSLAHDFQPIRSLAVDELIRDASYSNGQFALFSSLPSFIPFLGELASSIADLLILTKNQVTLVFRISAIYGRDIKHRVRVALEIAPVIGGAFLWRTMARSLVGLLPAPLSMIPKTIVAYTGTYVVGQIAHYYYREGKRPNRETLAHIRAEGVRLAQRIKLPGLNRPTRD